MKEWVMRLTKERDEARAEVERLKSVLAATEADVADFMAVLQWYFENDETQEGGTWEIYNAASLRVKREAKRLLSLPVRSYVKDQNNG